MKAVGEIIGIVLVYVMGTATGILVGIILNEFFERWSKSVTTWIFTKFGWDK